MTNPRHVTEATMRIRDVLYTGLLVRQGEQLTEEVARDRANNISVQVIEALAQLAEESKPPPVRTPVDWNDPRIK